MRLKLKILTPLLIIMLVISMSITACSTDNGAPAAGDLPGSGKTVTPVYDSVVEGLFHTYIVGALLEELGYTVNQALSLEVPSMHITVGTGDGDYTAIHWDPLQDVFYEGAKDVGSAVRLGNMTPGALQGYLIDKKTADAHGITNIEQLKDPEIARLFDATGDGKADLTGANPGWGAERVIEHHLDVYDLRDTVNHVQGAYFALMADTMARFERGEPILYYTWTPQWVSGILRPGIEVEWLEVPFTSLPEEQEITDTTLPDGRNLGFGVNTIRIMANEQFLNDNPAARRLFELIEVPIDDVNAQNLLIRDGEDSDQDIWRHAREWVEENRALVDTWIEEALAVN